MTKTAKCRACGAEIMFIKTKAGKTMPVDANSVTYYPEDGGMDLFVLLDGSTDRGRRVDAEIDGLKIGFVSHFATCPDAFRFRKPRKSERKRGNG